MTSEQSAISMINRDFGLEKEDSESLYQDFRDKLINEINILLDRDFEKLLAILYRIDVDEEKAKAVLASSHVPPSEILADLIIKRQMEKAQSRIDLSPPPPEDDPSW